MSRPVAFPYLRPAGEAVLAGAWTDGDGEPLPVEESLPGWDPAVDIHARRSVTLEPRRLASECGLPEDALFRLQGIWYCRETAIRGWSEPLLVPAEREQVDVQVALELPGGDLAGGVELRTVLVLGDPGSDPANLAPRRPGSMLWRDSERIILEGRGARFPVQSVEFPDGQEEAGWYLDIEPELDFPFLGAVRLQLNARHAEIREMLESTDPASILARVIQGDAARQLVRFALGNPEFMERAREARSQEPFEQESTGQVLMSLLGRLFPGQRFDDLAANLSDNPEEFDTKIQHRTRFLTGS